MHSSNVSFQSNALTSTGQQTRTFERAHPLLRVMTWEVRRFSSSRLFWLQALGYFGLMLFVMWASQALYNFTGAHNISGFVAGTSVWGLFNILPSILVLLVLLLPFVAADGVARDLQRRTHELLMTTVLPSWAYVWGRYLMALLQSLGLALLMLVAILSMGWLLHLTVADYPMPPTGAVLILWVGMVLSATILVSSFSFALGTLLPRLTTMIKAVIMLVWVLVWVLFSGAQTNIPPAWLINWDPTSAVTANSMLSQYSHDFVGRATSEAQLQTSLLAVENKLPDIGGCFGPHLILAGLSLLLVVWAAMTFRRFRNAVRG
jgi:ABC-type transport system involved in multi-copper enzyme maturation permease subunit